MSNFIIWFVDFFSSLTFFVMIGLGGWLLWTTFIFDVLLKRTLIMSKAYPNFIAFIKVRSIFENWLPEWRTDEMTKHNHIVRGQIIKEMHNVATRWYLDFEGEKAESNNPFDLLKFVGNDNTLSEDDILTSLMHYSETGELKNDRLKDDGG